MKKLFSLLLCVVMVLSLVACGSKTDDTQTPDEPQDTAPELSGTMKVVATGDVYGPLFGRFTASPSWMKSHISTLSSSGSAAYFTLKV